MIYFGLPNDLVPSIVVGFGYATRRVIGRKKRKPINELAFLERYGEAVNPQRMGD